MLSNPNEREEDVLIAAATTTATEQLTNELGTQLYISTSTTTTTSADAAAAAVNTKSPPGFSTGGANTNGSSSMNNSSSSDGNKNGKFRCKSTSFNKLAEAIGEGLANTMDADDVIGGGGVNHNNFVGANCGLELFGMSNSSTSLGGEMNNFQRQSRHAASRLKGKATYANLEHQLDNVPRYHSGSMIGSNNNSDVLLNQSQSTNAAVNSGRSLNASSSISQDQFLGGSYTASATLFSSVGTGNVQLNGQQHSSTVQHDFLHGNHLSGNSNNGSASASANALGMSHQHPQFGLSVNEPTAFNSSSILSNLGRASNGYGASNLMDKGVLDYMQLRDSSARGSGTGSAPPDFDQVTPSAMDAIQRRQKKLLTNNPTTEAQLAPFLRNPGAEVKPSRCLAVLVNCRPTVAKTIRSVCESFGGLEYFRSEFAVSKGVIFLSYFNLQHAQNAAHYLASRLQLNQTLVEPRIRYCSEINGSDETRLLISVDYDYYSPNQHNSNLDETTLNQILSSYGPIRNLNYQVFPGGEECFAVEFYDVMDAKQALLELQTTSHPVLPPIKIHVAGLSPKERKLARDLLQVISRWRSGSESSHPLTEHQRPIPPMMNTHSFATGGQISLGSHSNSRSHSPASMGMHSPVMFPPTPPRTPPIIIPGNVTPRSMHGSPVSISYAGGVPVATQSQQQPQTHLIVAPDGQISYYMCTTNPTYGNGQQMYYDQAPHSQGNAYRNVPMPNTGFVPPQHHSGVNSNTNSDYYSRRPHSRSSKSSSIGDDGNLQLNFQLIQSGQDARTSLMVKNIPNKYTRTMLLNELQENGFDSQKIDFFYLPIDFKNRCNRGYAFINFVDYRDIIPFWERYHGKHWKVFNSDKMCDITYARIQGKASMLKRFEHSALMEKDEDYQPLVFVSSGPNKGQKEFFPPLSSTS